MTKLDRVYYVLRCTLILHWNLKLNESFIKNSNFEDVIQFRIQISWMNKSLILKTFKLEFDGSA